MSKPFNQQLAEAIKLHRKQSGLTQEELAKFAGVGKTVVFDIEHGKESVKLNTILKILNVLNIQISLTSSLLTNKGR